MSKRQSSLNKEEQYDQTLNYSCRKKAIINKKFALKEIENLIEKIKKERLYLETLKANNTDQNLCDIREYEINCKIRDLITVCEFCVLKQMKCFTF